MRAYELHSVGAAQARAWLTMLALPAQVLRVLSRDAGDSGRAELPYVLRRPQRPSAPTMDSLSLARHLAVSDVQVRYTIALATKAPDWHVALKQWLSGSP